EDLKPKAADLQNRPALRLLTSSDLGGREARPIRPADSSLLVLGKILGELVEKVRFQRGRQPQVSDPGELLGQFRKRQEATYFCEWWFPQRECGPQDFLFHLVSSFVRCNKIYLNLQVWLKSEQVAHSEETRVNRSSRLNFEGRHD